MIRVVADNIYSPLGRTSAENYAAVKAGRTMLRRYEGAMGLPEPFVASLFDWDEVEQIAGYTRFERIVILSVRQALAQTDVDITSDRVLMVISTTKGNIELLASPLNPSEGEMNGTDKGGVLLGVAARHIADYFGHPNRPLVVSNACISGLCAQITAMRLLETGRYDTAVVVGADVQSPFIISGFQSLKALADEVCRPFDIERIGLNLGEAAATIIFRKECAMEKECWQAVSGAVRNDAFHISGPSPKGEGSFRAIRAAMGNEPADSLAFVNVHGTSTLYNDEMESAAIDRAGLLDIPVNSLKGYYGHTMGAAGVVETILSMKAIDDNTVLATKGFEDLGVSHRVKVSNHNGTTTKQAFLKLLSGFGGCNAAMLFRKGQADSGANGNGVQEPQEPQKQTPHSKSSWVKITPEYVVVNGKPLATETYGAAMLTELYRKHIGDYPKFFKMDELSRVGFLASELLLQAERECHGGTEKHQDNDQKDGENRAVVLFGRSGSLCNDRKYQETIANADDFFPSPALFVYTLPNIVTGEIAIRNGYHGETTFYVLDERDDELMRATVEATLHEDGADSVIFGWVDSEDHDHYEAYMELIIK